MTLNHIRTSIEAQLATITNLAANTLGENDPLTIGLRNLTNTPNLNRVYQLDDETTIETLGTDPEEGIVGYTINETGEATAITEISDETITEVNTLLQEIENELTDQGVDLPAPTAQFKVAYTKTSGEELTLAELKAIIDNPISKRGLAEFGKTPLTGIEDGDTPATKIATFTITEQGRVPLTALTYGIASYQGAITIPGIGLVSAQGSV